MGKRRPLAERFCGMFNRTEGCWIWLGSKLKTGYGCINAGGYHGRTLHAHRVAYELFFGPIPEGLIVMHKCDTPLCVNPAHLSVGTHADNAADRVQKNRSATGDRHGWRLHPELRPFGERHGRAKLTEQKVAEIRAAVARGERHRVVAAAYGVSKSLISSISTGHLWKHTHQENTQ